MSQRRGRAGTRCAQRRSARLTAVFLGFTLLAAACSEGSDDALDAEAVLAADREIGDANPSCEGASDGVLSIGSLLPHTGELAVLGPPMFAAAELAVGDINAAGGINGQPVAYRRGDEGTGHAAATVDEHLAAGVDAIVGAASTSVSESQFDTIISACKVMFSPANTGANFTIAEDDDLYFRTAPSDVLQGQVLAQLAVEDGAGTAAILARDDAYGQSLAFFVRHQLEAQGVEIATQRLYDPEGNDPGDDVDPIVDADPDALYLIGYAETSGLLQALAAEGFTAATKKIYLADGNTSNTVGESFTEAGALAGIRGTYPAAQVAAAFTARLIRVDPTLVDVVYGPETYDAVVITALAATAAGTDRPDEIARRINEVTRGGTACINFVQCRDLLASGTDIDYNGPSGLLDFTLPGEPSTATIAVLTFGQDNHIDTTATQYRNVAISDA